MRRLVVAFIAMAFFAGILFFYGNLTETERLEQPVEKTVKPIKNKEHLVAPVVTLIVNQQTTQDIPCEGFQEWLNSGGERVFINWRRENIYGDVSILESYGLMEESQLLSSAKDSPYAMFALGLNYFAYSKINRFQSWVFNPNGDELESKKFDFDKVKKSRYWFFRAAIHGYPTALLEASNGISYEIEERYKMALDDEAVIANLKLEKLAYEQLFSKLVPELKSHLFNYSQHREIISNLTGKERDSFLEKYKEFDSRLTSERQLLGLPISPDIGLSKEDIAFIFNDVNCWELRN